ncbi:hypothetical protein UA08_04008 [Talaromyces atroroseus]|uniref:Uncharacterized protein n=1 Tax=Talaromyces atroroseus TaxID=1441469 RepID=A0A1Q5Q8Q5_TALAT|nr:hypothetical protein UA08_04008 [Talaromyces atroroseus]OKL60409.1 hypothetical protein UA08_04008 [Talaromyces atroroseus]
MPSRYLSEVNDMVELKRSCEVNLCALDKLKASILSHQAQAAESLGEPTRAIALNKEVYEIRLQEKPRVKVMLCFTANNIAYCYNTANMHEESEKWRQRDFETAEAHYIEAQNAWLKGDQMRAHPFYAACLSKTGACCLDQGKVEAAIKHIRDSLEVTKIRKEDRVVEHARNLFKLSEAALQESLDDSEVEAAEL